MLLWKQTSTVLGSQNSLHFFFLSFFFLPFEICCCSVIDTWCQRFFYITGDSRLCAFNYHNFSTILMQCSLKHKSKSSLRNINTVFTLIKELLCVSVICRKIELEKYDHALKKQRLQEKCSIISVLVELRNSFIALE